MLKKGGGTVGKVFGKGEKRGREGEMGKWEKGAKMAKKCDLFSKFFCPIYLGSKKYWGREAKRCQNVGKILNYLLIRTYTYDILI